MTRARDDIVGRLRALGREYWQHKRHYDEAADEIERLWAQKGTDQMKCTFCSNETVAPWRSVCASCFDEQPTAVEILAMDLSDLQDSVAELFRRLSGEKLSPEVESAERKARFERMLALVEAAVAEKRP